MRKIYNQAELQIVRMHNNDIVTTSVYMSAESQDNSFALSAGRRFDDWDAGY